MSEPRYFVVCDECGGDGYIGFADHRCRPDAEEDTCVCGESFPIKCHRCDGEGGWSQATPPDDEGYWL